MYPKPKPYTLNSPLQHLGVREVPPGAYEEPDEPASSFSESEHKKPHNPEVPPSLDVRRRMRQDASRGADESDRE